MAKPRDEWRTGRSDWGFRYGAPMFHRLWITAPNWRSRGAFLAFLDGDDLWGADWLRNAYGSATETDAPARAIWHPRYLYYFTEGDFEKLSVTTSPDPSASSFVVEHTPSSSPQVARVTKYHGRIVAISARPCLAQLRLTAADVVRQAQ